jgi:hypothetical protein
MPEDIAELAIPLTALLVVLIIVVTSLYFRQRSRDLRHRERMAALEKGMELPPEPLPGRNTYLLRGLVWLFTGVAIGIFFLAMSTADKDPELPAAATLGLIPAGVGIAYLVVYRVEGKRAQPGPRELAS